MDLMQRRWFLNKKEEIDPGDLPSQYRQIEYIETIASAAYIYIPLDYIAILTDDEVFTTHMFTDPSRLSDDLIGYHVASPFDGRFELRQIRWKTGSWGGITFVEPVYNSDVMANEILNWHAIFTRNASGLNILTYQDRTHYTCTGRIYSLYITRSGDKILDLVPCVRKSDRAPGLYDKIGGEFFSSVTESPFVIP